MRYTVVFCFPKAAWGGKTAPNLPKEPCSGRLFAYLLLHRGSKTQRKYILLWEGLKMKFKLKAALAVVLVALMALAAVPVSALPRSEAETPKAEIEPYWTVPDGYNAHDYNKCVQFLEQTDEYGVKNGEKIGRYWNDETNSFIINYNPSEPDTWGDYCFIWTTVNGEQRVLRVDFYAQSLCGRLDLSGCTALEELGCDNNHLTELDVAGCTALEYLDCAANRLASLNASGCTSLRELSGNYNNLTELDITGCTALEELQCSENSLYELDVSGFTALEWLVCSSNDLTELNVTGCTALKDLSCDGNKLTELDVTQNTALEWLGCSSNDLTELDVSNNTALKSLSCSHNNLSELDVSGCTALEDLDCFFNNLSELDITNNTTLVSLYCSSNNLTELDITNNTTLELLDCSYNNLTELDLRNNPFLAYDHIRADGSGFIGYHYDYNWGYLCARPANGAVFEGFYDENGALISEGEWDYFGEYQYWAEGAPTGTVIARFSGGALPGDLDGNGSVSVADAISTLRLSMGISDGSGMNTDAADMDGNGNITLADAIVILRIAMGLA